jgi:hypothetical protein
MVQLHLALDRARTVDAAAAILERVGTPLSAPAILTQLRAWRRLGLVFEEGGRFVALATCAARPISRVPDRSFPVQTLQESHA